MSHRGRRLLEEADALSFLLFNCAVMFLGAFFVGMIPLVVDLDPGKVRLMGIFSAGLMLGCALAVIVPEGAEAFFEAREEMGEDVAPTSLVGGALIAGFLGMVILESACSCVPHATVNARQERRRRRPGTPSPRPSSFFPRRADTQPSPPSFDPTRARRTASHRARDHVSDEDSPSRGCRPAGGNLGTTRSEEPIGAIPANAALPMWRLDGFNVLFGILVHSLADGLAVGVAALSPNQTLGGFVAFAIVAHKAPAAFGLCAYLLDRGWGARRAREAMGIFASASPVAALATFLCMRLSPWLSNPLSVPLCLLLSGGTFLHAAAAHALPEATGGGKLTRAQIGAVACGALSPFALSMGHSHAHGGHEVEVS